MGSNPWGYQQDVTTNPAYIQQQKELQAAKQRLEAVDTKPNRPDYAGFTDANGGLMSQYKLNAQPDVGFTSNIADLNSRLSGINLNTQGLEALRARALATGQSPWAAMMLEKQGVEQAGAMDQSTSAASAAQAQARSVLGSRGGVSSASRANLARKGMMDLMKAKAGVNRQGQLDRLGIQTTDEQQKLDLLKMLPGAEVQALQPELQKTSMWSNMADNEAGRKQTLDLTNRAYKTDVEKSNIGSLMTDLTNKNKYGMDSYSEQMKAWAAERTAKAQENSGGGVSWICTEVDKTCPFTEMQWRYLNRFKKWALTFDSERSRFYFEKCRSLVGRLVADGVDFGKYYLDVKNVIEEVAHGAMLVAGDAYWQLVRKILAEYAPTLHGESFDVKRAVLRPGWKNSALRKSA